MSMRQIVNAKNRPNQQPENIVQHQEKQVDGKIPKRGFAERVSQTGQSQGVCQKEQGLSGEKETVTC